MEFDQKTKFAYVTRHEATREFARQWIAAQGADMRDVVGVMSVNKTEAPATLGGRVVVGNLPLHLACHAKVMAAVEFEHAPRGQEYTRADMDAAGVNIATYVVRSTYQRQRAAAALVDSIVARLAAADLFFDPRGDEGDPLASARDIVAKAIAESNI